MLCIILFIKGCVLGLTAVIPGVSVGTMALVLGVYEKSVHYAVGFLSLRNLRSFQYWRLALLFVLPLAIGGLISMFVTSRILVALFEHYSVFVRFMLFGIICGSIPHLFKNHIVPLYRGRTWVWFCMYCALGLALIHFLSGNSEVGVQSTAVTFSFSQALRALSAGAISAAAGIVPGISGSYMLLLMGYYEGFLYITSTLHIPLLIFFIVGNLFGFISVAVFVSFVFTKFPAASYAVVLGIVVGSLTRIISIEYILNFSVSQFFTAFACIFLGTLFMTAFSVLQSAQRLKHHRD